MRPNVFTLEGLMLLQGEGVGQVSLVFRQCSGCGLDGYVYARHRGLEEFLVARVFTQDEALQLLRIFHLQRPANFHSFAASVLASNWWKEATSEQIVWEHDLFELLMLVLTPVDRVPDVMRIRQAERMGFARKTWVN